MKIKIYNNTNDYLKSDVKYTHLDLFDDIKKNYIDDNNDFDVFPIDIEMYQYIGDNYVSKKLEQKTLNSINHYVKKHNAKTIYYFYVNENVFVFTDKSLNNITYKNLSQLKNKLNKKQYCVKNIYIFMNYEKSSRNVKRIL